MVFNFQALAYAAACSQTMSYAFVGDAEILILAETIFNFHALASARAYVKTMS